ncbi:MAG TPA: hypothetical protein DHV62_03525, partial [Elusimicrobia bacterium]|nr:hypothetical protein [Elusimicrobiota bacterium]
YLFLFLPFAYLALKARRYMAIFSLVNSLVVVENLTFFYREYLKEKIIRFKKYFPFFKGQIITSYTLHFILCTLSVLIMVVLFFFTFRQEKGYRFGLGIKENVYPVKAAEFIEKEIITSNHLQDKIYNSEEYGGYLVWKWFPERKVFIFNDNLLFYDLRRKVDEKTTHQEDILAKFGINCILKSYVSANLENYYLSSGNWKLVWWDDQSLVYLKNIPENKGLLSKYTYKYIDPLNFNLNFAQTLARHNFANYALEELNRSLAA